MQNVYSERIYMGMPISIDANRDSRYKHSFSFKLLVVSAGEAADSSLFAKVSESCKKHRKKY